MSNMIAAHEVLPAGSWPGAEEADRVYLDYDSRHRRRLVLTSAKGVSFLLDLARPAALADGDGLQLDDGRVIAVAAEPEDLLAIECPSADARLRIAWHLGNRHLPVEFAGQTMFIRADHVIAEMLVGLGAKVESVHRGFQPEGGAYGTGRVMGHDHGHSHSHSHGHDHDHSHDHDHGHHHHHHGDDHSHD